MQAYIGKVFLMVLGGWPRKQAWVKRFLVVVVGGQENKLTIDKDLDNTLLSPIFKHQITLSGISHLSMFM